MVVVATSEPSGLEQQRGRRLPAHGGVTGRLEVVEYAGGRSAAGCELLEGAPQMSPADLSASKRQMPVGRIAIRADEGGVVRAEQPGISLHAQTAPRGLNGYNARTLFGNYLPEREALGGIPVFIEGFGAEKCTNRAERCGFISRFWP